MKASIKAKAFNGNIMQSEIELFVDSVYFNTDRPKDDKLLSIRTISEVQKKLFDYLKEVYPDLQLKSLSFRAISRDLENLKRLRITPDGDELARMIFDVIKEYMASELGFSSGDKQGMETYLRKNEARFCSRFCPSEQSPILNPLIQRAYDLLKEKKYQETTDLLGSIQSSELNEADIQEREFLKFALRLNSENADSDELQKDLKKMLDQAQDKPSLAKRYYFEYIRFLENVRDEEKPGKLIKEFERRYPLSILNAREQTIFNHLKGRAEYARGEFLTALDRFADALKTLDPLDKAMRAAIFNSSVNSFTDNLFFEEAMWIAEQAKDIRLMLDVPESLETISCIAGIHTKHNQHKQAYQLLLEAREKAKKITLTHKEQNRLYNYLAKSAIFCELYQEAEGFLNLAEQAGDARGFSKTIRLLLLYKTKQYEKMRELFVNSLMLPEHHAGSKAYNQFVLGWGYTLMAMAAFEQGEYRDGVMFLLDALDWFVQDKFYLEAGIVALYGYIYQLPEPLMETYCKVIRDRDIRGLFEEYVEKHAQIRAKYYPIFNPECREQQEPGNLEKLADSIRGVNEYNYDPDGLRSVVDKYCLI